MSKLNIYACSGVGAVSPAQRVSQDIENSGWMRNETLRKYLGTSKDGGCAEYFLYIFIPDSDLAKYNATIIKKRKQQLKTYAYVRELFVGHQYGSEAEMKDVIRRGIEKTFGADVETVLYEIQTGKREGIGLPVEVIVAIISAVTTIVLAVISGIISYCQGVKIAQYTAPTFQELEASAPASSDFTSNVRKKGMLWAAVAGVALLVVGAFKK